MRSLTGLASGLAAASIWASLGVLAVIDPRTAELSSSLFVGNLCLLAAALTWALYSVLVRRVTRTAGVLAATAIMFVGGLPVAAPLGAWEIGTQGIGTITSGIIAGILFIGIVCTAIASCGITRLPSFPPPSPR